MPRRYRIRLGDGTVLMVDQQGLNTWKVDAKAMVQAAGGRWRPLKDLIAMQQAAAKHAEQNQNDPAAPAPVVLPLIPPPPKSEKFPRRPSTRPAPQAVTAPPVIEEPPPIPVLPEEPAVAIAEAASPEPAIDEGPPISPADFRQDEDLAPFPDAFSRDEAPVLAAAEPPEPQAWADEPAEPAIFNTAAEAVSAPAADDVAAAVEDEVASLPPPGPAEKENAWDPEPSQWSDAVQPPAIGAQKAVQSLADDPVPRRGRSDEHFAHGESPSYTARSSSERADADAYSSYAASEPGFEEEEPDDFRKPRPIVLDERFVRVASVVGAALSKSLEFLQRVFGQLGQALGKAWAARAAKRAAAAAAAPPETPSEDQWPAIVVAPEPPRMQALADAPSEPRYVEPSEPRYFEPAPSRYDEPAPRPESRYDEPPSRPTRAEDLPLIPLKPVEAESATRLKLQVTYLRLRRSLSAWAASFRSRVEGLARRLRPAPATPARPWSDDPERPSTLGVGYEPPFEPVKPPPPTSQIQVLRLAKIEEVEEPQDMYEGPSESFYFPTAWLWAKRLAWTALFAAGGFLVYRNWEAWSPKAKSISTTAFTEVTKYAETREQKLREQQALQAATEQIPHLTLDTIRLVFSRNTSDVPPDPPEVFQVTCNAADRGLSALTPVEREELKALRQALLNGLSPAERVLLRDYDDVRSRRTPFAFEDKSALDLFARGVRTLPEESRQRLQELVGEAVASGLAAPSAGAAKKATR